MGREPETLSNWLSTYQWVTVGRLLEDYHFQLSDEAVLTILSSKSSFYYHLLEIPMGNVLNGIILEQIKEYQLFLQKLFVDYLVSGESDREAEEPGGATRQALETQRSQMLETGKAFDQCVLAYESLIIESQAAIRDFSKSLRAYLSEVHHTLLEPLTAHHCSATHLQLCFVNAQGFQVQLSGLAHLEKTLKVSFPIEVRESLLNAFQDMSAHEKKLDALLETYHPRVQAIRIKLNDYRKIFYEWIGVVQNLLLQAAPYKLDEAQDALNREKLHFKSDVGVLDGGE